MLQMRPAEKAWLVLMAGIVAYEIAATEGELLSEQCDRWLMSHPKITTAAVVITAAHLLNWLDPRVDPFHWVFSMRGRSA